MSPSQLDPSHLDPVGAARVYRGGKGSERGGVGPCAGGRLSWCPCRVESLDCGLLFCSPCGLPSGLDFDLAFGGGCVTAGVELQERVEKAFSFARALRNMVLTVDVAKGESQESWGWREKWR